MPRGYVTATLAKLRTMVPSAYLRVFQPLDGFERSEQLHWERWLVAGRGRRELGKLRRRDPHAVPFVRQSAWHVPLRWFVLFRPEERSLADDDRGRLRLRYRAPVRRAMRRVENVLPTLRRSDLAQLGELVVELHQWIATFDPKSVLELDYGELSDL